MVWVLIGPNLWAVQPCRNGLTATICLKQLCFFFLGTRKRSHRNPWFFRPTSQTRLHDFTLSTKQEKKMLQLQGIIELRNRFTICFSWVVVVSFTKNRRVFPFMFFLVPGLKNGMIFCCQKLDPAETTYQPVSLNSMQWEVTVKWGVGPLVPTKMGETAASRPTTKKTSTGSSF